MADDPRHKRKGNGACSRCLQWQMLRYNYTLSCDAPAGIPISDIHKFAGFKKQSLTEVNGG